MTFERTTSCNVSESKDGDDDRTRVKIFFENEFLTNLLVITFGLSIQFLTTVWKCLYLYQALKLTGSDCQLQVEHVKISDHSIFFWLQMIQET